MALSLASGLGQELDDGLPFLGGRFTEGGVSDLWIGGFQGGADFLVGQPMQGLVLDNTNSTDLEDTWGEGVLVRHGEIVPFSCEMNLKRVKIEMVGLAVED
jgi:hypothetical protein